MLLKCLFKVTEPQMSLETEAIAFLNYVKTLATLLRCILPWKYFSLLKVFCVSLHQTACISLHLALGLFWSWMHQHIQFHFNWLNRYLAYRNRLNHPLQGLLSPGLASWLRLITPKIKITSTSGSSIPPYILITFCVWRKEDVIWDSEIKKWLSFSLYLFSLPSTFLCIYLRIPFPVLFQYPGKL